jgi:hypothetical protein
MVEGANYQWFHNDTLLTEQTSSLTTMEEGIYRVKLKKGEVEITSPPFEIIVNALPEAEIVASGDLSFCPGGSIQLTANVSNNASWNWMKNDSKIQGSVSAIDVSQSGSYSITATANGCSVKSAAVNVQVYSENDTECTTGIEENEVLFKVYPNPFRDSFILEAGFLSGEDITAELYNSLGTLVKNIDLDRVSGKTVIDVENPGFYTLRVKSKHAVKIFKLVGN